MNIAATILCPLCNEPVEKLVYRYHFDNERRVIEKIKQQYPAWSVDDGACSRCLDYYQTELLLEQRMLPEIGPYFPVRSADDFIILPTGLRLNADPRFTGKGITICFIDSGFFPHPDLIAYKKRIRTIIDIPNDKILSPEMATLSQPEEHCWHGTMTTVVCAGDGYLSNGLYKGIASDAELVLLKVQDNNGAIISSNMAKALQWVEQNHRHYNIRIVNISLGDDHSGSYRDSETDQLAEKLIAAGIVIIAAAGNDENGTVKAPANSPNVITVGGVNDNNDLHNVAGQLYHSTFGKTADGFMKPELLAPAIWIAAPILPCTLQQQEAELLHLLLKEGDLVEAVKKIPGYLCKELSTLQTGDANQLRQGILQRMQTCKYISPHYMHVDGTSFAAPIVAAVVAQLLEADPTLTPVAIRHLLFRTASRLPHLPVERQGYGTVQPKKALLKLFNKITMTEPVLSPVINNSRKTINFFVQHECASQVSLAGTFNHWEQDVLLLEPQRNGSWQIEIPILPAGRYLYKFLVDDKLWIEDINNPYREPDGFSGFNSILIIEN